MELETLGPRARGRKLEKYFRACEQEGYESSEARGAYLAAIVEIINAVRELEPPRPAPARPATWHDVVPA